MNDVYVILPCGNDEDPAGWKYLYVSTVPGLTDMGEVVAACQVLYPMMIGISIEPENTDA